MPSPVGYARWTAILAAAVITAAAAPIAADDAEALARRIEGVYKRRFRSGVVEPEKPPGQRESTVMVEDVIEIVRTSPGRIYVRAALNFYNGHICGIYGVAQFTAGKYVYRSHPLSRELSRDGQPPCTLTVSAQRGSLVLTDRVTVDGPATCATYCGARGSLSDYRIPMSRRRPIRYLPLLTQSKEYATAVRASEIDR